MTMHATPFEEADLETGVDLTPRTFVARIFAITGDLVIAEDDYTTGRNRDGILTDQAHARLISKAKEMAHFTDAENRMMVNLAWEHAIETEASWRRDEAYRRRVG
jgi:hypothetical protein